MIVVICLPFIVNSKVLIAHFSPYLIWILFIYPKNIITSLFYPSALFFCSPFAKNESSEFIVGSCHLKNFHWSLCRLSTSWLYKIKVENEFKDSSISLILLTYWILRPPKDCNPTQPNPNPTKLKHIYFSKCLDDVTIVSFNQRLQNQIFPFLIPHRTVAEILFQPYV